MQIANDVLNMPVNAEPQLGNKIELKTHKLLV
jgi:hypothetical protein